MKTFLFHTLPVLYFISCGITAKELSIEEYMRMPRLFNLDDYHRCMSQKHAVYCVGEFHMTPSHQPHPIYELMEEHSKNHFSFNHTRLHRGYCLNTRCPSSSTNSTLRFENCMSAWARKIGMRATLQSHYCHRTEDKQVIVEPDVPQQIFLYFVYFILLLNFIGTAYDIYTNDKDRRNKFLLSWSIQSNWNQLVNINDHEMSANVSIHGARFFLQSLLILGHTTITFHMSYLNNPKKIEEALAGTIGSSFVNGSTLVLIFIIFSCFTTGQKLLSESLKSDITAATLFKGFVRRIFRIAPVYIFVVAYGATWWPQAGDGPLWPVLIDKESQICRRKFWSHLLFINNLVRPREFCFVQTWSLAVDMHLYLISSILTLILLKRRARATHVLGACFVLSCLLNISLAYVNGWKSAIFYTVPENVRNFFHDEPSLAYIHMSTWGNLPAGFLGLLLAHMSFESQLKAKNGNKSIKNQSNGQEINYKQNADGLIEQTEKKSADEVSKKQKYVVDLASFSAPLIFAVWIPLSKSVQHVESLIVTATYVGVERLACSLIFTIQIAGIIHSGALAKVFAWRGFQVVSRLTLAVLMIHWCVNISIVANRDYALNFSVFNMIVDWLTTLLCTYILAVPVTLLLEFPMRNTLESFLT